MRLLHSHSFDAETPGEQSPGGSCSGDSGHADEASQKLNFYYCRYGGQ